MRPLEGPNGDTELRNSDKRSITSIKREKLRFDLIIRASQARLSFRIDKDK